MSHHVMRRIHGSLVIRPSDTTSPYPSLSGTITPHLTVDSTAAQLQKVKSKSAFFSGEVLYDPDNRKPIKI